LKDHDMKTRIPCLVLSVAIAAMLAACHDRTADDTTLGDTAAPADATPDTTMPATPAYDDNGAMAGDTGMVATGPIADTLFYQQAMAANASEIAAGTMAQAQALDQSVKDYAQMMVTDHTAMNQQVAEAAGMADAATPAPDPAATADLQGKSGADFDRAYIDMMVADHQKVVAMVENASTNASTDAARTLATNALPKLREHLQRAQEIQAQLGGASDAMGSTPNP
jgi:putative membrane protein